MGKTLPADSARQFPVAWAFNDTLKAVLFALLGSLSVVALAFPISLVMEGYGDILVLLQIFLTEGLLLVVAWVFSIRKYGSLWSSLGFRRPANKGYLFLTFMILLGSLGFNGLYVALVTLADWSFLLPPAEPVPFEKAGFMVIAGGVGIILLGPLAEETFFRGFLLQGLATKAALPIAVGLSSLVFGLSHGGVGLFIPATASGLLLAWLFLRTGSLWPPIAAHSLQNALAYLAT